MSNTHVLIFGGTTEAVALAAMLESETAFRVTTSLAGRTREPRIPAGALRSGGFGGREGLTEFLRDLRPDVVVDATHPFAAVISKSLRHAADQAAIPRLTLLRPAWQRRTGDDWVMASNLDGAARLLAEMALPAGSTVFVSTGGKELQVFRALWHLRFVVRLIESPGQPLPAPQFEIVKARGPFSAAEERALLARHQIKTLVAKKGGGDGTYAKLVAARTLNIPVIMIERPPPEPGQRVDSVERALDWIRRCAANRTQKTEFNS